MVVTFLFFIIVLGGGGYFLFLWLRRAWKKADVQQRIEDIELEEDVYGSIVTEDSQTAKEVKEKIEEFLDETE